MDMNQQTVCTCLKKKKHATHIIICTEEYEKCPKWLNGEPHHGHKIPCKLCAKLVSHYHCVVCFKYIITGIHKNNNYITNKIVIHQGKECFQYIESS